MKIEETNGGQRRGVALHNRENQGIGRKQVCTRKILEGVIIGE